VKVHQLLSRLIGCSVPAYVAIPSPEYNIELYVWLVSLDEMGSALLIFAQALPVYVVIAPACRSTS